MSLFKVPDITCAHCEKAIRTELTKDDPKVIVSVDLKSKTVAVENMSDELVSEKLKEIGYNSERVK